MSFLPAIGAGISGVGSIVQSFNQKALAQQNQNSESAIDNELVQIYGTMLKNYNQVTGATDPAVALKTAEGVYGSEAAEGLSPATIAASNLNLKQQQQQGLNSIIQSLGPSVPNLANIIKQYGQQTLQSDVAENIGLAGESQGVKSQGAAGLAGIGSGVLDFGQSLLSGASGGLAGLGKQFGAASAAPQTNPLSGFGSLLAALGPSLFGTTGNSTGIGVPNNVNASPSGGGISFDPSQFLSWLLPDSNSGSLGIAAPGSGGGGTLAPMAPAS